MREILFRGKTRRGTWLKGFLFQIEEDCCTRTCVATEPIWANDYGDISGDYATVIPETIGQYTGLTDKNGKKIFEGDIIRAFMDFGPAGLLERIASVGWHDKYGYQWNYFDTDTIEVIGNIHDNPELLKGGAE